MGVAPSLQVRPQWPCPVPSQRTLAHGSFLPSWDRWPHLQNTVLAPMAAMWHFLNPVSEGRILQCCLALLMDLVMDKGCARAGPAVAVLGGGGIGW